MSGDLLAARRESERAIEQGTRHGNLAAEVIGRTAAARVTILEGRVADGLAQLDEVGGILMSGDVDLLTTGMMLCELVCAAQGLARHDLAAEWTEIMDRWSHGAAFGGLSGRCRVHRAEILRVTGPCHEAEDEALAACDELRPWMRREFGWPLAELGNIRLRRGDLRGAEEAFLAAHEHAWSPYPGLALLRLAQGEVDLARSLIAEAIEHPFRAPSKERPPFSELTLAPLLEAQVEIATATGDAGVARAARDRLCLIAHAYPGAWLGAVVHLAEARTAFLDGDLDLAVEMGTQALSAWADIGAPYETASTRMLLGDAHAAAGRESAAAMEWMAATRGFERYGAVGAAAQARVRLDGVAPARVDAGTDRSGRITPARMATFRREGYVRVVEFAGESTTLRDLKGMRYIARLLADPGREFHVLDLVSVEQGSLPVGDRTAVGGPDRVPAGSGLPVLDERARRAYQRRLADVEDDIDDAVRDHDSARIELAERDREFLMAELRNAVGLSGRLRSVGSDTERARTAVARALRYATNRLGDHAPAIASHLRNCLHTGTYCTYRPDPLAPVEWSC